MRTNRLNAPWTLAWDRDGTEDFGTIYDADGNEIVSSQDCQTCWLPEPGQPVPQLVRQLLAMEAAPKMVAALEKCEAMLRDYKLLAEARAVYFGVETGHVCAQIEATRQEALVALTEARGER